MKKKTIWITAGAVATALVVGGIGVAVADPFDDDTVSDSAFDSASSAGLAEVGEGRVTDVEGSDDRTHAYEVEVTTDDGRSVDVYLDEQFDVLGLDDDRIRSDDSTGNGATSEQDSTTGSDDAAPSAPNSSDAPNPSGDADDQPISADERESAESAALAEVGDGTVTDLDRSDDRDHAWEVEITLADGSDVDVELDDDFAVTRVDRDDR